MIQKAVAFGVLTLLILSGGVYADWSDRFFAAYFLLQQGDTAERDGDFPSAHQKFSEALAILNEIKTAAPEWRPGLVAFRIQYCADRVTALTGKAPVAPPPAPGPTELEKARAEVKQLVEERDRLAAQLQAKLKEPAPTYRDEAKQTLEQLHALQAANEAAQAKLAAAESKAARVEQLTGELSEAQKKIHELESGRDQLNAKLQDALAKVAESQTSPQIEQMLKKNAETTEQLAGAQAEIAKLREQLAGAPSREQVADSIKLRAELEQARSENQQLLAKLAESDRQLRAVKVSNEKSDQIIQQLRKENELLKQLAAKQTTPAAPEEPGGFLWFKPKRKPAPVAPTNDVTTSQSEAGKLTVTVKSPPQSDAAKSAAEEIQAAVDEAVEGAPEVRLLLAQAKTAMAQKDFATAKIHLTTAAEKEPGNLTVFMNLGISLYQLNQLDEAVDTLRKIIAVAPNQSSARSLLGIIHLRRGRTEEAYSDLTRAVALDPRNAEAHNYLGIVMNEKGWATAAEGEIRRALELNPGYADAHFNLAVLYSRQKTPRRELARQHYQKALDLGAARDEQLEAALKK